MPPKCFDMFKVHTQSPLTEGELEAASLVFLADRLSSSNNFRGKGIPATSPNPREGKCLSQGHIASQQCTEDSNLGLYALLDAM